jgi:hypothetical protein
MRTFGLSRFFSSQSGWATARARFFGAAVATGVVALAMSESAITPKTNFLLFNMILRFLD